MKGKGVAWLALLGAVVLCFAISWAGEAIEQPEGPRPWKGRLADGREIGREELEEILRLHRQWVETDRRDGQWAYLHGADLTGASLKEANLSGADLGSANLTGANLSEANLRKTNLVNTVLRNANLNDSKLSEARVSHADLTAANLANADLTKAILDGAKLTKADLSETNLSGAKLSKADLSGLILSRTMLDQADLRCADLRDAVLFESSLKEADLTSTDLSRVVYEPMVGKEPQLQSMATANGMEYLAFQGKPQALLQLREDLKKVGFRKQEREVNYAIKHTQLTQSLKRDPGARVCESTSVVWYGSRVEAYFCYLAFELTCQWGMSPFRPLKIMMILMVLFALLYVVPLRPLGSDGIWRVWPADRLRKDQGRRKPERLILRRFWPRLGYALYFSLLSAFHIGWREFNVGNWISRLQPREYTLRATGWVRVASGLQSLISVYLLALAVLTYFGRPFE